MSVSGETGDLRLLGSQEGASLHRMLANGPAGGQELTSRASGERLSADATEYLVRSAQLLARLDAPVLGAQPFAVQESRAGGVDDDTATGEPLDRLAVEDIGFLVLAQQRRIGPGCQAPNPC